MNDPERLARFQREAKVLASLNHPNIAAIHGLEESGDSPALVLEYVEGPTLQDRIARGPIPLEEALPIARQIAEALEAAHEQGIIHRDLKPANVKVKADGTVKVLDFGLAKALQPELSEADAANSPTMTAAATRAGIIMGTAAYMSPEQAAGKPADRRSDNWSFGVVLWEMLTGQQLFTGESISHVLAAVLKTDPEWDELPQNTPRAVRRLLRRCLERNAKQRLPDAAMARLEIDDADDAPGGSVGGSTALVAQPELWQRPVPVLVAAALLGGLIVGALALWNETPVDPPLIVRVPIPLGDGETITNGLRHVVAISPDGRHIVYSANGGLTLRPVDQLQGTPLPGTDVDPSGGAKSPFFSPDGQWIGYEGGGRLKKVALGGGAPITLAEIGDVWGANWGADDTILFGRGAEGIWQVSGTGGTPEQLIAVEDGEAAHGPQMLPGGEWVLFTLRPTGRTQWDEAQIVVQSLDTDERVVVIEGGRDARYLPTGHLVYGLAGVVFAVAFDPETRQLVGGAVSLVEGVSVPRSTTGAVQFSVASNGSLVYAPSTLGFGSGERGLMWVNDTGQEEHLQTAPGSYLGVSLSPDGTQAAVGTTAEQNQDLWVAELERGSLTRVTTDAAPDTKPLWTPDGASVVYESLRDGTPALYRKAADGTGTAEHLFTLDGATEIIPIDWTLDGTAILVVVRMPETSADIGLVSLEAPGSWEPLIQTGWYPALSPDGRWIAYTSNETDRNEVYVQRFPELGQRRPISIGGGFGPSWSSDGSKLFYLDAPLGPPRGMMRVSIESDATTLTVGQPEKLFDRTFYDQPGRHRRYDLSSDGRFLMINLIDEAGAAPSPFDLVLVLNWFSELQARVPTGR